MRSIGAGDSRVFHALLAAVLVVAVIGVTGGLPSLDETATHEEEPPTTWTVDVRDDGDARITIAMRFRLGTENETRAFGRLSTEFENGSTTVLSPAPFERAAGLASEETNRSMSITAVERATAVENDTGTLALSFTWRNFARVSGDRIVVGDAFQSPSGTWLPRLTDRQEMVIDFPPQYAPESLNWPLRDGSVFIEGPVTFDPGEPAVTFEEVNPNVSLRSATLSSDRVRDGESVDVIATVENTGRRAGSIPLALRVDGETVETRNVTVGAESSKTVTFTRTFASPDAFDVAVNGLGAGTLTVEERPANLSVRSVTLDRERIGAGESVTVRATVANDGSRNGTLRIEFTVNGSVVDTRNVTVPPEGSQTVNVTQAFEEAGTFSIAANGVEAGTLTVAPSTSTVTGSPTTEPSPGSPTTDSPADPLTTEPPTSPPTASPGPPEEGGITFAIALFSVIVLLGALAYVLRDRDGGIASDVLSGGDDDAGGSLAAGDDQGTTAGDDLEQVAAGAGAAGAAASAGGEETDAPLLSDEERVLALLQDHDGRMKQAEIVDATGWSNAKVSQLLSGMAEDGKIRKLRIGRENLITLPEEAPEGID